jgi:hypothetical protein
MRRRFGRRRRSGGTDDGRPSGIDSQWLARVAEEARIPAVALAPLAVEEVPASLALLGSGESEGGERCLVAVSRSGGDALIAVLAVASRLAEQEGFRGTALAVAPGWSLAARQRLALVGELPYALRAESLPQLESLPATVEAEPMGPPAVVAPSQVHRHLARPADQELCRRALAALSGLAAKHGGAIRGVGRAVELVLLARRVAAVRVDEDGVLLDTWAGGRRTERLSTETLADALDRLEGSLRKHLNERENRDGEPGLRSRLAPRLAEVAGLRGVVRWPLGGRDLDALDFAAVTASGRPAVGALRTQLNLSGLGPILDAAATLAPALPGLLEATSPPVRLESPCIVLGAEQYDAAVARVLGLLSLEVTRYEIHGAGGREPELRLVTGAGKVTESSDPAVPRHERIAPAPIPQEPPQRERRTGRSFEPPTRGGMTRPDAEPLRAREPEGGEGLPGFSEYIPASPPRARTREPEIAGREAAAPRFEEVSLFELSDGDSSGPGLPGEDADGRRRRRRRRGRGRGRLRRSEGAEGGGGAEGQIEASPEDERPLAGGAAPQVPLVNEEESDLGETLAPLAPDVPEFVEEPEPSYDDEEEGEEEADPERERMRRERELRRRARIAKAEPLPEPERPARPPRPRRAAIVAHADRDSLAAATLLARDLRLLEGIWVYPQNDLMTFFRGVAPDLREETPIYVIGFMASPARETIQTASLYRERIFWFDHHEWPPEDVEALREAVGREAVHVAPHTRSAIPLVLSTFTRRSRFSDKFVDLMTGRFTQHDFERWGRVWWSRLEAAAARPGDRRAELEPLLAGRPSDLSRDAALVASPPIPAEVDFVAARDFRLVHFGGYVLVMVPVPAGLDVFLSARIARERYAAELSLGWLQGEETFFLASDEGSTRRSLDVLGMVEHLAGKHTWIQSLPDADHVARFRIQGAVARPERIDEALAEIAMGRSILEG